MYPKVQESTWSLRTTRQYKRDSIIWASRNSELELWEITILYEAERITLLEPFCIPSHCEFDASMTSCSCCCMVLNMPCITCGLFAAARFHDRAAETPFGYVTFSARGISVVPGHSSNLDYHVTGIHKFFKKLGALSILYVLKGWHESSWILRTCSSGITSTSHY